MWKKKPLHAHFPFTIMGIWIRIFALFELLFSPARRCDSRRRSESWSFQASFDRALRFESINNLVSREKHFNHIISGMDSFKCSQFQFDIRTNPGSVYAILMKKKPVWYSKRFWTVLWFSKDPLNIHGIKLVLMKKRLYSTHQMSLFTFTVDEWQLMPRDDLQNGMDSSNLSSGPLRSLRGPE